MTTKEKRLGSYELPDIITKSFRLAEIHKTWCSLSLGTQGRIYLLEIKFYYSRDTRSKYKVVLESLDDKFYEILAIASRGTKAEFKEEVIKNIENLIGYPRYEIKGWRRLIDLVGDYSETS